MSNAGQRIIPLEEGWNDEIKAKASQATCSMLKGRIKSGSRFSVGRARTFLAVLYDFEL